MFNQKIKNNYLFFLILNAFLLITLPFFTQNIFAQNNEEPKQTQNTINEEPKQTQNTHNVNVQDDSTDIVDTINGSFADKNKIGMAKVIDDLKIYAETQHSDKAYKRLIQDVVSGILNNYLCIDEWAEVKTDFFATTKYDGDWMKDIVASNLTNTCKIAITAAKSNFKSNYNFVFEAFDKDLSDAVSDTMSTLWPKFAK
ncbi:MAG: hypothetical protein AB3N34_00565 [Lettuce witches'-broom phytoplasma]